MGILLTPENVLMLCNGSKERALINQRTLYHKVTVFNGAHSEKDKVLLSIMDFVYPRDFIPIGYHIVDSNSMFLVQNCAAALEHLCQNKLTVFDMKLNLVLAHTDESHYQFDPRRGIMQALQKRYNPETKTLDLTEFHKDKNLDPNDYCVLSQPRLLKNVLSLIKPLNLTTLVLAKNHLKHLKDDVVRMLLYKKNLLKTIDLQNNEIENVKSIMALKMMEITELILDENPLCQIFDERNYMKNIQDALPSVEKLDGRKLSVKGLLPFRRNYLIDRGLVAFTNNFIEHFFQLYDSEYRYVLNNLYESNSMFSMTCDQFLGHETIGTSKLERYKMHSRNILRNNDFSKNAQNLYVDGLEIIKLFIKLPKTQHDPHSFTVDVPFNTEEMVNIVVTGVYKELAENVVECARFVSFQRSFYLCPVGSNCEFVIRNEHLHVANATDSAKRNSFRKERDTKLIVDKEIFIPEPQNQEQEKWLMNTFSKVTMLNSNVARTVLEKAQWNFNLAIHIFNHDLKGNKIPMECFTMNMVTAETKPEAVSF